MYKNIKSPIINTKLGHIFLAFGIKSPIINTKLNHIFLASGIKSQIINTKLNHIFLASGNSDLDICRYQAILLKLCLWKVEYIRTYHTQPGMYPYTYKHN